MLRLYHSMFASRVSILSAEGGEGSVDGGAFCLPAAQKLAIAPEIARSRRAFDFGIYGSIN
jgi:hypothetical protein